MDSAAAHTRLDILERALQQMPAMRKNIRRMRQRHLSTKRLPSVSDRFAERVAQLAPAGGASTTAVVITSVAMLALGYLLNERRRSKQRSEQRAALTFEEFEFAAACPEGEARVEHRQQPLVLVDGELGPQRAVHRQKHVARAAERLVEARALDGDGG